MRRLRWLAVTVAAFAVLGVAAAAFVATLDMNAYKSDVQAALEDATGRRVEIAGPLDLAWTPRPSLTASGVRVANAEWASAPAMAMVGELSVGVEILPLLFGRVEIHRLRLSDVRLSLERGADGLGNWNLDSAAGGGSAGGGALPEIRRVDLARIAVAWKSGPKAPERVYRIARLSLAGEGPAAPLALALSADLDGDPLELAGSLPAVSDLRRSGAALPVDVKGALAGTPLALTAVLQVERDPDGPVRLVRADRLRLAFGDLAGGGSGTVDLTGARPRIEARVEAGTIDLDRLGSGTGDPLDRPLPTDLLTLADGRVEVTAARLVAAGLGIDGLTATATLEDGVLTLDPIAGDLADGPVAGRAVLDGSRPTARLTLAGNVRGMDMGTVYRALMDEALIEGRGDALLEMRGRGDTPRALLRTADGVGRLVVHEGVILNRYWELIAEDVATRFLPFVRDADRGRLNCLVGRFDIAKGIARATVLLVDSERVTVAGEGTVDLAAQTLDMRLVPRPKDPSLFSLATPILLTGPLSDPRPAPDPVAVAKGIGGLAAGTMLGPFGLLLPFMSTGTVEEACPAAIAAAEGRPARAGSKTTNEQDKPGGIKGLFDNLRKAIE